MIINANQFIRLLVKDALKKKGKDSLIMEIKFAKEIVIILIKYIIIKSFL